MNSQSLIKDLRKKICREIDVESEGVNRLVVNTPFTFDDGDHYVIALEKEGDEWVLTDDGHTLMHLSYSGLDLRKGRRGKIIEDSLRYHGVENRDGVLRLIVPGEQFGDALFSYLQAISKATNVTNITKEVAKTTFFEDFSRLISDRVPEERYTMDWTASEYDPKGLYKVDCRINAARPWLIFAINSNYKCQNAVITCLQLEKHIKNLASVAIFEDQTNIDRRPLAQLSDVIGKQFSSLDDQERIGRYISDEILATAQ